MENYLSYETNAKLEKIWYASLSKDNEAIRQLCEYYLTKLVPIAYKYLRDKKKATILSQEIILEDLSRNMTDYSNAGLKLMKAVRISCLAMQQETKTLSDS